MSSRRRRPDQVDIGISCSGSSRLATCSSPSQDCSEACKAMRPPRLSLTLRFHHQYPHSPHTQNGVFVMLHRSPTSGGKPPSRERCDVVQSQLEISSSCLISILITIVNTVAFSSSTQIRPRQIGPLVIFCGKLGPGKSWAPANWAPAN